MAERLKHTDAEKSDTKKSSTVLIYEACIDLHNQEQLITRDTLQLTLPSLTRGQIDDRLKYLVDQNQIKRIERGVYVPVQKHRPARIISKSVLPDGTVKFEIGDEVVITLTPKEARDMGLALVGEAMTMSNIEAGRVTSSIVQSIGCQLNKLTQSVENMCATQINSKET